MQPIFYSSKIKTIYFTDCFIRFFIKNKNPKSIASPQIREITADLVNPAIIYVTKEITAVHKA